jgi:hypothetical protein
MRGGRSNVAVVVPPSPTLLPKREGRAAGAEIVHPPKDAPYGRNYWANDPEGHPWFFTEPPKEG